MKISLLARVTFAALLAGCGSHPEGGATSSDAGVIAECEAFLASYQSCLASLGSVDVARARVAQTRAALVTEAQRGDSARTTLRQKCVANLSQLKTSCQ